MASSDFATQFGDFRLQRYPQANTENLRAWNAADRLLIAATAPHWRQHCVVANDDFGALNCALAPTFHWTDSALAQQAVTQNLKLNKLAAVTTLWSNAKLPDGLNQVVMRTPKQLAYFEYQLSQLSAAMPAGGQLLVGGMDKHLSRHTAALIERYIGPTQRHRGEQKARIFSALRDDRKPVTFTGTHHYHCNQAGGELVVLANGFSREQIDIGSRLLLQYLPSLTPVASAADLACGNGVLGLAALQQNIAQSVVFCDESAMAIAAAKTNAKALGKSHQSSFVHGDGLRNYQAEAVDLILCNPPFHSGHTVDERVGRRLLQQAARALSASGSLCLVANRHLPYYPQLKRLFHQLEQPLGDNKFTVYIASKPRR